jgi:choline dehydrogenase
VVGGGNAGLAIASRLAQSYSASVVVVEAGGVYEVDNGNQSVVPYYSLAMPVLTQTPEYRRQPLVDWDLVTVPQPSAGNRRIHYARGKTLGGYTALNTMAYLRGTKGFHHRWALGVGEADYEWVSFLPFKKS